MASGWYQVNMLHHALQHLQLSVNARWGQFPSQGSSAQKPGFSRIRKLNSSESTDRCDSSEKIQFLSFTVIKTGLTGSSEQNALSGLTVELLLCFSTFRLPTEWAGSPQLHPLSARAGDTVQSLLSVGHGQDEVTITEPTASSEVSSCLCLCVIIHHQWRFTQVWTEVNRNTVTYLIQVDVELFNNTLTDSRKLLHEIRITNTTRDIILVQIWHKIILTRQH